MEPWLLSAARRSPDQTALIAEHGPISYETLYRSAAAAADELRERGVGHGDPVALVLPPGQAFAVAVHATLLIGGVIVPVDLRLTDSEQAIRVRDALVVDQPLADGGVRRKSPTRRVLSHTPQLEDPAAVIHTSGTTAAPKPITLSLGNFLASALGSAVALGLDPHERWLCPMPLVHVGGLSVLIRAAIYGTTAVVHERFDTERVLDALVDSRQAISMVSLVPTMLARLLEAGLKAPPTLRWALLGGGPIPPALLDRARGAGVPVASTYGMTEACSQIATHGWPLPGTEVRLAQDGEVLVQGGTVAPGALAEDGWLHTGDLGWFDDRGRLCITGRKADTIVTGGENVSPSEVEAVLLEHPGVLDAGVFARPDREWGEAIVAAVVTAGPEPPAAAALLAHCAARLARYKVPKAIEFSTELPRSPAGKLLRRELARSHV